MTRYAPAFRRLLPWLLLCALALTVAGTTARLFERRLGALPVISPQYQIFVKSGPHSQTLAGNNGVLRNNPGLVHKVDGNQDGIPDVEVQVTVDSSAEDLLTTAYPNLSLTDPLVAPIIDIRRAPESIAAKKANGDPLDPIDLTVVLTFTIEDKTPSNPEPPTYLRFGYSTGPKGNIPTRFNAVVGGVETFFNPMLVIVDSGKVTGSRPTYNGPLTLIAGTQQDKVTEAPGRPERPFTRSDYAIRYRPFPDSVQVKLEGKDLDNDGQKDDRDDITYSHQATRDIDVSAEVDRVTSPNALSSATLARDPMTFQPVLTHPTPADDSTMRLDSRVDRLPSLLTVKLSTGDHKRTVDGEQVQESTFGTVDYTVDPAARLASGRRPDAFLDLTTVKPPTAEEPTEKVTHVVAHVEQIPHEMHGEWAVPEDICTERTNPHCLTSVLFEAKGTVNAEPAYVGAVEASISNVRGSQQTLTPLTPSRRQYLSRQSKAAVVTPTERLTSLRVERIRRVEYDETQDGLLANADVGDGVAPLELHVATDERHIQDEDGKFGEKVDATATVTPLPRDVVLSIEGLHTDNVPLVVDYKTCPKDVNGVRKCDPKPVTVDGHVEVRKKAAANNAVCGAPHTTCADIVAKHIPSETKITVVNDPLEQRVLVDATDPIGGIKPDLFANVTMRAGVCDAPIVADVDIVGVPRYVNARLKKRQIEETVPSPAPSPTTPVCTDPTSSPSPAPTPGQKVKREEIERVEIHPCNWNFDATTPGCAPGTEGTIGSVQVNVRNFLSRPASLPHTYGRGPLYAAVRMRPPSATVDADPAPGEDLFEVSARLTEVKELQYVVVRHDADPNDDVPEHSAVGVRAKVGDGTKPLHVTADLKGVEMAGLGVVDLAGESTLQNLPKSVDICFRTPGGGLVDTGEPITDRCENNTPFPGKTVTTAPMSLAYDGDAEFTARAALTLVKHNDVTKVEDNQTIVSDITITNVPADLTVHVATPTETSEAIRTHVEAPGATKQMDMRFKAALTDGDLVCGDPRTPAEGMLAICVSGLVEHLPNTFTLDYDPAVKKDNLSIVTDGSKRLNLKELSLTAVKGDVDEKTGKPEATVIVAEGQLLGLPKSVKGTLLLPGDVDITAEPAVEQVDINVRNFIAPDPFDAVPAARALKKANGQPVPAPSQQFFVLQRGDLFKAEAHVTDLVGAGYGTQRDSGENLLDTTTMRIDFGKNQTIRAYADLEYVQEPEEGSAQPPQLVRILADAVLDEVPSGLNMCFRGKKTAAAPPVQPTFCDTEPADDEGAFRVVGKQGADITGLDVYAFFRMSKDKSEVFAARADITNVPFVVQGTFSDGGTVEVEGMEFDANGDLKPDGIDKVDFEIADADIDEASGFVAPYPWGASVAGHQPFDNNPVYGNQYVRAAADDTSFRVKGAIGAEEASGAAGSNLQRFFISDDPCARPEGNRADYPRMPDDVVSEYICLRADFEQVNGGTADPLGLEAKLLRDGIKVELTEAQLLDIPAWIQVGIAETAKFTNTTALRTPCGPEDTTPVGSDCMAPFLRVDSAEETKLVGSLVLGHPNVLSRVRGLPIGELTSTNLLASPVSGWGDWGSDPLGIRAQVGVFDPCADAAESCTEIGVLAGIRLRIPHSVQVDQVQSWSGEDGPPDIIKPEEKLSAPKDIRFRYSARGPNGEPTGSLGELAARIQADDKQFVLSSIDNVRRGFAIPSELGLSVYLREGQDADPEEPSKIRTKRIFAQVDGRVSEALNLRMRMTGDKTLRTIDAKLRNVPAYENANDTKPSFRVRAEILDKGEKDTDSTALKVLKCFLACTYTLVEVDLLTADLDFAPTGTQARRIDAVFNLDLPQIAVETRGFDDIDTKSDDDLVAISGKINVEINPMVILLHYGIPVLGDFNMVSMNTLNAEIRIDKAKRFRFWNNVLHIKAEQDGVDSSLYIGYRPALLQGIAFSILGVFIGNPVLYGFTWAWPPLTPPDALMTYYPCLGGTLGVGHFDETDIAVMSFEGDMEENNVIAVPFDDPRFVDYGSLETLSFGMIERVIGLAFCLFETELPLMNADHPGLPILVDNHPVPGLQEVAEPLPPSPPPPPNDLTVANTVEMCGNHSFANVTVPAGTTLKVATAAGDRCVAADAGMLNLTVLEKFDVKGTIDARPATGVTSVTADNILLTDNARVFGGVQRVGLTALDHFEIGSAAKVEADGVNANFAPGPAVASNSGAGHGGVGGRGTTGAGQDDSTRPAGGPAYGDPSTTPVDGAVPIEAGSRGAGPGTPGNGGGTIYLTGNTVRIAGTVSANGFAGSTNGGGSCSVADNPDTEDSEAQPNQGTTAGAGGGSGGGVVIGGVVVDATGGTITATGGSGGAGGRGGGGGGAGGVVKVLTAIYKGSDPSVAGGGGGATLCGADFKSGTAGNAGDRIKEILPASKVRPMDFWHRGAKADGTPLKVPYTAAVATNGASDSFQVVLCGSRRPPDAGKPKQGTNPHGDDFEPADDNFGIDMPASVSVASPCGSDNGDSKIHRLGSASHSGDRAPAGAEISASKAVLEPVSASGYWGLYTVVLKPGRRGTDNGNSCTNHTDHLLFGSGIAYDNSDCTVEFVGPEPDYVIGIDNNVPTVTLNGPDTSTAREVVLEVKDAKDVHTDGTVSADGQSGVVRAECSNDKIDWKECPVAGTVTWELTEGTGDKKVYVRVFDHAGNFGLAEKAIRLDVDSPVSFGFVADSARNAFPPDGKNGWYVTEPHFAVNGVSEDIEKVEYWFNGGNRRTCTLPCHIGTNRPGSGRHTFNWRAIDKAGNVEQVQSLPYLFDDVKPKIAVVAGPGRADGANGWYVTRPYVVASAVDGPSGSGLATTEGDPPVNTGAGVQISVGGGALQSHTTPLHLAPGTHKVCAVATDVAGHVTPLPGQPGETCAEFRVDADNPGVNVTVTGTPFEDGFYRNKPKVTLAGTDATGSSVNHAHDADLTDLCGPLPAQANTATPSGVCVSIDGKPFQQYTPELDFAADPSFRPVLPTTELTLNEGVHEIRSFSIDVSGRRSDLRVDVVKVDLSAPTTLARTLPPVDPSAVTTEVRRTVPALVLSAFDNEHGSGVDKPLLKYSLDGGANYQVYTGPVPLVPDSDYTVKYFATDVAGNVEAVQTLQVFVDSTPPTARATQAVVFGLAKTSANLLFEAGDTRSTTMTAHVYIYGELIPSKSWFLLRKLTTTVTGPGPHMVEWDGKRDNLFQGESQPVQYLGNFHYRVVVTDGAGNVRHSSDSAQAKLGVL